MVHDREVSELSAVSIGVAASIGPELAGQLAPLVEAAGFQALWVNDTPGADAFAVLESAGRATETLTLATGVLAVDRRPAAEIGAAVGARRLPQHRLVLGIGSGQAKKGALQLVREEASALRAHVEAKVVVGALGPKMRDLAVEESDGVLLSWLTPTVARDQADEAHASSPTAHVALYVRAAFDPAAGERLRDETARYAGYAAYAANFARLEMDPLDTVLDPATSDSSTRLSDYRHGADEVVLRAITLEDTLDHYRRFIDEAQALL